MKFQLILLSALIAYAYANPIPEEAAPMTTEAAAMENEAATTTLASENAELKAAEETEQVNFDF